MAEEDNIEMIIPPNLPEEEEEAYAASFAETKVRHLALKRKTVARIQAADEKAIVDEKKKGEEDHAREEKKERVEFLESGLTRLEGEVKGYKEELAIIKKPEEPEKKRAKDKGEKLPSEKAGEPPSEERIEPKRSSSPMMEAIKEEAQEIPENGVLLWNTVYPDWEDIQCSLLKKAGKKFDCVAGLNLSGQRLMVGESVVINSATEATAVVVGLFAHKAQNPKSLIFLEIDDKTTLFPLDRVGDSFALIKPLAYTMGIMQSIQKGFASIIGQTSQLQLDSSTLEAESMSTFK